MNGLGLVLIGVPLIIHKLQVSKGNECGTTLTNRMIT